MKKIILTTIIVLTTIAISKSQKNNYSDLTLANIEALATNESIYDYRYPKTVSCDLQEGGWHTASVERICVFSATPSSCTAVACGKEF